MRAFTVEDLRLGLMNTRKRFPGMSVENCLKTLEREQPALVRAAKQLENESSWDLEAGWDMETGQKALQEQTDEAAGDAEIRIKIAAMRKVDPSLSFERAWDILRQKEPELFGY